ncbi:MAG: hydrogenase nickel incorporation protein HypB, partial [Planctomycetales bacterium]
RKLPELGDGPFDFLFIEDVGNLICPASHDLGEHLRVIVLSVAEGDDKPGKYPKAFRTSQAAIISKVDLLPHVPFSMERCLADVQAVQPSMQTIPLSALTGEGMDEWIRMLLDQRDRSVRPRSGQSAR